MFFFIAAPLRLEQALPYHLNPWSEIRGPLQEALYRFLANPKVTLEALIEGHVKATVVRLASEPLVRVLHDSSPFRYSGDREGLGIIRGDVKGFMAHVSLAVAADDTRRPFGVLAVSPYVRMEAVEHRKLSMKERRQASAAKPREERESHRWERQAIAASARIPAGVRAVHVMDQEADDFVLFAALMSSGLSFVVRVSPGRKASSSDSLSIELASQPATVFRTVRVNRRPKKKGVKQTHPVREERDANLHLRWGTVTLARGWHVEKHLPRSIQLHVVQVFEPEPPDGEEPIEWMLVTSEPVTDAKTAEKIVDHYRARWLIEEYFKALKTGCSMERRQLTSFEGLTRALGLFIPVAWHLLLLRHTARATPNTAASIVFNPEQLLLLALLLQKRRYVLPRTPTVRDAMLGIAALGGHISNNGDPGWQVLGRGFTRFVEADEVWRLARSDQS